jgi:Holliday junction DNA helicase RuvA
MVHQLGHRVPDARRMVADALKRNPAIDTPEALFEEVYRGEMSGGAAEPSTGPPDEKGSA